jgi:large subunit ribosomal protein L31
MAHVVPSGKPVPGQGEFHMQEGIHPNYRPVVFRDQSANYTFITRSTVKTDRTIVMEDGETYPVVDVELSDMSHPFYTGKMKIVDTAGRVDRFNKRFGERKGAKKSDE